MNRYHYNNIAKRGRIGKMWDIWKMWQIVRFLKGNRFTLAQKVIEEDAKNKTHNVNARELAEKKEKREKEIGRELSKEEISDLIVEIVKENDELDQFFAFREAHSYNREATVDRNDLVVSFLADCEKLLMEKYGSYDFDQKMLDVEVRQKKIELNSIIQSCIDNDEPYIKEEDDKKTNIYLTAKGKKFAGIDGLLKAWIVEFGVVSSVLLTAFVGSFPWIVKFSSHISPWW